MCADQTTAAPTHAAEQQPVYTYAKKKDTRWWEVRDSAGELVCLTVYRRGAREVVRRLSARTVTWDSRDIFASPITLNFRS